MFRIVIIGLLFVCAFLPKANAQGWGEERKVQGVVIDGDTIPRLYMDEVIVFPHRKFKNERERQRYYKLIRYVKKVYPLSVIAKKRLQEIERTLRTIPSKAEQEAFLEQMDEAMQNEFEDDIRDLTFSQGKILIKLIDRETGDTSYGLIKQFRGNLTAMFWQGVAVVFGANLKEDFDPENNEEDAMIDEIVILIENGQL